MVCSQNTHASEFVKEEIVIIKDIHCPYSIIPVLVGGLPNNETNADNLMERM